MSPAEQLTGLVLDGDWEVIGLATKARTATGGNFSQGYIVQHRDGRRGFLKAMDFTKAMNDPNPAVVLQAMTTAYVFEQQLCEKCAHLSRVVRAIGSGVIQVKAGDPFTKVQYLIFELAEGGDIRKHLEALADLDAVFIMKTLHDVATGLSQLHRAHIAHQDLKPSNVLVCSESDGSKICDLGRAWDRNISGPYDSNHIAGDQGYAPPELLYLAIPSNERARRYGCDMYHLGSLLVFCFTNVHINGLLANSLHIKHRPLFWGGSYEDVLPFIQAAFESALQVFEATVPDYLRNELVETVRQLCNPDPERRGHPSNGGVTQYSLERYISKFDRLTHLAKLALIKRSGC